jgi:hypothetical protein
MPENEICSAKEKVCSSPESDIDAAEKQLAALFDNLRRFVGRELPAEILTLSEAAGEGSRAGSPKSLFRNTFI